MSYKDRLDSLKNDKQLFKAETRSEEIQKDMMNAFADGSVFGELVAEAISATVGKAIDKFGIDNLVTSNIEGFKSHVSEAVVDYIKDNDFLKNFSEKIHQKEAERGKEFNQDNAREMGA
jgi:hypothetical protein